MKKTALNGAQPLTSFSNFSMGINVSAVAGLLVCGSLAQKYQWHLGFRLGAS